MSDKTVMRVLRGEVVKPTPTWLMRQAGRYLPEYRETRKQAGSFLDLCYTPELAEEVTLQPIRRYDFDAAILFADILLIPQALGQDLWFVEGEGPKLNPIQNHGLQDLKPVDEIDEVLSPVYETVRRLSTSLPQKTTLIGFAGAPWTVATYMIAGKGTPDQAPARRMMYEQPAEFAALIDRVTDATIHYLSKQIDAGAEVVKLFDSWSGTLPAAAFSSFSIEPARKIRAALKERHPNVPFIGFPRGAGTGYLPYAKAVEADCLATDPTVSLSDLREATGDKLALQGNLDPLLLSVAGTAMEDGVRRCLDEMRGAPHIFNLGHGITPDVNPDTVSRMLEVIRSHE